MYHNCNLYLVTFDCWHSTHVTLTRCANSEAQAICETNASDDVLSDYGDIRNVQASLIRPLETTKEVMQ